MTAFALPPPGSAADAALLARSTADERSQTRRMVHAFRIARDIIAGQIWRKQGSLDFPALLSEGPPPSKTECFACPGRPSAFLCPTEKP
jgi:hypothetical protein